MGGNKLTTFICIIVLGMLVGIILFGLASCTKKVVNETEKSNEITEYVDPATRVHYLKSGDTLSVRYNEDGTIMVG